METGTGVTVQGSWTQRIEEGKRGISGSTLKLIAIITMIIDHGGTAVVGRYLWSLGCAEALPGGAITILPTVAQHTTVFYTYMIMRQIGRIAFPIYCFLLVEGLFRSKNVWKYELRLLLFAVISEIPFDLAIKNTLFDVTYQNVFFTLLIGLLTIHAMNTLFKRELNKAVKIFAEVAVAAAGALVAQFLHTDYGATGVLCIVCLYIFAGKKIGQMIAGCVAFFWELTAPLAFIPIAFYNGKRGWKLKYLFYVIYPAHLLILYLVSVALGLGAYPAL